jgi:tRNA threonylcarbamoyladenosine biosynthesis protein TsaE
MKVDFLSSSEEDTYSIALALGEILKTGDVVALTGELGAGKTLFCKGVGEALGISRGRIVSPSFTMVTEYSGRLPLCHVDAYRLVSEEEALDIGLEEVLTEGRVFLVEWAEKILSLLPNDCIRVTFSISGEDRRRISVEANDDPRFAEFVSSVRPLIPGG